MAVMAHAAVWAATYPGAEWWIWIGGEMRVGIRKNLGVRRDEARRDEARRDEARRDEARRDEASRQKSEKSADQGDVAPYVLDKTSGGCLQNAQRLLDMAAKQAGVTDERVKSQFLSLAAELAAEPEWNEEMALAAMDPSGETMAQAETREQ